MSVQSDARNRLLDTAYELFSTRGVRGVGIDEVVAKADVAKATLYRHFPSKDELVLAFLQEREHRWTFDWVAAQARQRGDTPEEHLLGIFDLFDEWFRREDFEGCSFINVLLEMSADHPAGRACVSTWRTSAASSRSSRKRPACATRRSSPGPWHILMKGSIVQAAEGDVDAARRAQALARLLIEQHRAPAVAG